MCSHLRSNAIIISRKWLKVEAATIDDWMDIVDGIYVMEKISHSLKVEKEKLTRN